MGFLSSLFGSSKAQPGTTTNVVQQKLAPEIAPFAKEVLTDAQALYKSNLEKGYDPYTGQTIAPLTPEQQQAMAGISGLVGTTRPLQEEALATYRQGGDQFTPEVAQQFMSPYQQSVVDIEKRKAQENFEGNIMPQFEANAISRGGGPGGLGTRAGIEAAELQRGQSQLLADIQAKGSQSAFADARKGFEQQQTRERQMAGDVAKLGPAMFASGLQEQGALQSVGEEKQQLGQSVMDESYFKFLEEQQFPQQQLANYSGFVYGNPAAGMVNQTGSGTKSAYQPSFGQNIMGIGSMLASSAMRNPNLFAATGGGISGLVRRAEPGQVGDGGFLNSPFVQDIKGIDEALAPAARSVRRGLANVVGYPADVGRVLSNYFAGTNIKPSEMGSEDLKGMLNAGPTEDETITKELTLQDREAGNPELEVGIKEISEKEAATPQKQTAKVIQTLATSSPKALTNSQSAALTMKEAGKIFDEAPEKFGALTRKQYLADTKAQNEKYLAFVNKMYPEGQNEFLADALAALGSMFIAENKGEAFQKTFSELQASGVKRRDARRIAIGKVGLDNLKRDDATLEKIRMLPKKRRDALLALVESREKTLDRESKRKYQAAKTEEAGQQASLKKRTDPNASKYKPKTSKIFQTAVKEDLVKFMTADSGGLLDIATSQLSKPGVAEKFAQEQGIKANDIGSLTDYMKKAFKDTAIQQDALSEAGKIFAKGDISEQDAVIRGMFTVLKKYKYKPETGIPFTPIGDPEKFERIR